MNILDLDLGKLNIKQVGEDVNLFLYNNGASMEHMKLTNLIVERLKNVKIKVYSS